MWFFVNSSLFSKQSTIWWKKLRWVKITETDNVMYEAPLGVRYEWQEHSSVRRQPLNYMKMWVKKNEDRERKTNERKMIGSKDPTTETLFECCADEAYFEFWLLVDGVVELFFGCRDLWPIKPREGGRPVFFHTLLRRRSGGQLDRKRLTQTMNMFGVTLMESNAT